MQYLDRLNPKQKEAATTLEGPLMVLAGAGSGKTGMLTARMAYLIDQGGLKPYEILAVTFTNKAAQEMRGRVNQLLSSSQRTFLGLPEVGTFHSICLKILRREAHALPFTKPFVIYDDSDQKSLIKSIIQKLGYDDKQVNPKNVQWQINQWKCDAMGPEDLDLKSHHVYDLKVKKVYEQYQKELVDNNAVDFGEMITMTYRLLRDHDEIRARYQQRYQRVHVDEYQDTNRAQYLLLAQLSQKRFGGHENLCVVGDEDQSIYKWRGADIRNILEFEKDYLHAKVIKLEQNYRSTKTIVESASALIQNNTQRKEKKLWTDHIQGEKITHLKTKDDRDEAERVIHEIKRIASDQSKHFDQFAIFYRTNAQSRPFEDVFRREKIAYQIFGGLKFYDRKEIKDILSYFRFLLNPSDSISLKRIINTPARGIGKSSLEKIESFLEEKKIQTGETNLFFGLKELAQGGVLGAGPTKKVASFVQMMEELFIESEKLLLSELYHKILDDTGYVIKLKEEATDEALSRIENLEEFDTVLREFEEDQASLSDGEVKQEDYLRLFLEQIALSSDLDQENSSPEIPMVKLMTLHTSKGLEFPVVFMVGMEDGLFPSIKGWESPEEEDLEEERRLCYVGMTRAREKLFMVSSLVRRIWGQINYQEPSRFFLEIPDQYIETKDSMASLSGGGGFGLSKSTPSLSWSQSGYQSENDKLLGKWVDHPEYGRGKVIQALGASSDRRVTVQFRNGSQKKFLWQYLQSYEEA